MQFAFTSQRRFAVGLALLIALAAIPLWLSHSFGLPYIDHPDEPSFYLQAQVWRGALQTDAYILFEGYPPGYLLLHQYIAQPALEAIGVVGVSATVRVMRAAAVLFTLATMTLIGLTAYRGGSGTLGGLIAAALWGFAPAVITHGVYAIPDPAVCFFVALAAYFDTSVLVGLLNPADKTRLFNGIGGAVGGTAAGLAAGLFKFTAAPAAVPGVILLLYMLITRVRLPRIAWVGLLGVLFVPAVILLVRVSQVLQQASETMIADLLGGVLNPARVANNFSVMLTPLSLPVPLGLVAVGAVLSVRSFAARPPLIVRERIGGAVMGMMLVTAFLIVWATAAFAEVTLGNRLRDVLPATALIAIVIGVLVGMVVQAFASRRWVFPVVALVAFGLFAFRIPTIVQLVQDRQQPDRRVQIHDWVYASLDPAAFIVSGDYHKVFNPYWSGLPANVWINWIESDNLLEKSLADWRDQGAAYAIVSLEQRERMRSQPEGRAMLDDLLLLREFTDQPMVGEAVAVYRLERMTEALDLRFGDQIALVGLDRADSADSITFRFYWNTLQTPTADYSFFIHLTPPDNRSDLLAQVDGSPARPTRPTTTWAAGETLISAPVTLSLPVDACGSLWLGVYDFQTGVRLETADGDDVYLGDVPC